MKKAFEKDISNFPVFWANDVGIRNKEKSRKTEENLINLENTLLNKREYCLLVRNADQSLYLSAAGRFWERTKSLSFFKSPNQSEWKQQK